MPPTASLRLALGLNPPGTHPLYRSPALASIVLGTVGRLEKLSDTGLRRLREALRDEREAGEDAARMAGAALSGGARESDDREGGVLS